MTGFTRTLYNRSQAEPVLNFSFFILHFSLSQFIKCQFVSGKKFFDEDLCFGQIEVFNRFSYTLCGFDEFAVARFLLFDALDESADFVSRFDELPEVGIFILGNECGRKRFFDLPLSNPRVFGGLTDALTFYDRIF